MTLVTLVTHASFAGLSIALDGLDAPLAQAAAARFAGPRGGVAERVDARLRFTLADRAALHPHGTPPHLAGRDETFDLAHTRAGAQLDVVGRSARARFIGADADVTLAGPDADAGERLGAVENLLRVCTARLVRARGGLLLHSAALAPTPDAREAIVLVGRSGAGKSTASAAARALGRRVLSDELNAVVPAEDGALVCPVPFAGDHAEPPTDQRLRVRGVYLLEQGTNGVRAVSRGRAAAALVAAAPFVNADPAAAAALLDHALALARAVPVRALSLARGADAWAVAHAVASQEDA